ncbi:MAG: hypothetical protein A2Y48_01065 [Nitrospirae bacterium RIFCSPLOW2_12_42_9]|nr:MAG: hypothetical protein A2Z60_02680 [Nitrospirae bacterium RIFCSPLOWO2_02_42_7]OGW59102.1 MAG: hypothetical protein A3D21_07875 [Nitrospirae bacterium RIFCSPHIGHO2_02_FULL_42_12]OGW62794.1 MAG: hypothetical protein A2Y48_01065 [Nitrospirae bacterium RIFCSPLOW2_12_42_9]
MIRKANIAFLRVLTIYLVLALLIISAIPAQTTAMFITPGSGSPGIDNIADMEKVKTFLETKIVQQRLADFGLTADEISLRLEQLSHDQLSHDRLHKIATDIDHLDYGGDDGLSVLITILVIVILVIVVLKLMGRQIIIK